MEKQLGFSITPIKETNDGIHYRINVDAPMTGWYDDMYFVVENEQGRQAYKIKHKENRENMVSFESDIFLPSRAMYRFYFSYNLDGEQKFIKKKQMTESDIYRDEMFKMAVNFSIPDWAKGKIMYHIFLDGC